MSCHGCGATTTNGLALCDLCQTKVSADLEYLPIYFRNLARWRPGRAGSRPVPGWREPRMAGAAHDRVGKALEAAYTDVAGWARALAEDRPGIEVPGTLDDEGSTFAGLCRMLAEHLTTICTLEWCGVLVAEANVREAELRTLTEAIAPGWYAGACRRDECGAPTYVVHGLTWVTCRSCGSTTYARDHLDAVIEEARAWVARPMRLAEAVVALTDETSVPRLHKRIARAGEQGRLLGYRRIDRDGDEVGPRSYRLGDVLDLLARDTPARVVSASADGARRVG